MTILTQDKESDKIKAQLIQDFIILGLLFYEMYSILVYNDKFQYCIGQDITICFL